MNYQKAPAAHESHTRPPATDAEAATFHDILPKIRGLIARSLLDDAAWDRLLDRTGDLPAWWSGSYFGFEFRLGDKTPAADFFVGMLLNGPLVREYIRRGEATKPSSAEASFARFLAESSRANARWADLFSFAGLECDIAEVPRDRHPAPGVFLRLRRVPQTDRGRVPGLVSEAIAEAVGWRSDERERRMLERAFAALPPGGEVGYVGALPDRSLRAIRVIAQGIGEPNLSAFLERLGWPGPADRVAEVLSELRDVSPHFRVAFDVTARGLLPRLGLEMGALKPTGQQVQDREWLHTEHRDWVPLVTRVAEKGWCLPAKAHGLLAYPGQQMLWDTMEMSLAYKGINHIKISIDDGGVSAKGYVGMLFKRYSNRTERSEPPGGRIGPRSGA